jgi:uncharacterized protein
VSGDDAHNRLELLVIQPTSFCNLNCSYCYVPDRSVSGTMSTNTLLRIAKVLERSRRLPRRGQLEVLWHAGEPLAAGLAFYQTAASILNETLARNCRLLHTFQTNGTLITNAWCDYFKATSANVGVSVDGPRDLHDAVRPYRRGRGSHEHTMRGLHLLRAHGLELNVLCVLTAASLHHPERMFDFFHSNGVSNLGFNVEEVEGAHTRSSLLGRSHAERIRRRYSDFMIRLVQLNEANGAPLRIREFQVQGQHLWNRRRDKMYVPKEAEQIAGRIITISKDGEVFSWSPELASGLLGDAAYFSLGNVHATESLDDLLDGARAAAIQTEILHGIEKCRRTCKYFVVCGGGSPANKFYENGSFDSTDTVRCRLHVQALTDVILEQTRHVGSRSPDRTNPVHANRSL